MYLDKISLMSTTQKIKRTILIALGFALATYLIMSGSAILSKEDTNTTVIPKVEILKK